VPPSASPAAVRLASPDGGPAQPFEVWVNGAEQPRGLGALAKTLSMDLRANDPAWLQLKLDALATVAEERSFEMPFPPHGEKRMFPGVVAATAAVVRWRCEQLKALPRLGKSAPTPVLDAMFSREEPHTGPSGTLAWAVDVDNPATGESFTLTLKEVTLPGHDGGTVTRPCAVGFSGNYPRALDGLARLLSLGPQDQTLVEALQRVHSGGRFLPPPVARALASRMPDSDLSSRELEVLRLLVSGNSNKDIANLLGITEATVKSHVSGILRALKVSNRTEIVIAVSALKWELPPTASS